MLKYKKVVVCYINNTFKNLELRQDWKVASV